MRQGPRRRSHQRLFEDLDVDPLSGMANLFDAGMVFAVALLVAMLGRSNGERVVEQREELERFRASDSLLGGDGERLGTAYRLKSGEIVYVPSDDGDR